MIIRCEARIARRFKTVKAESVWPENQLGEKFAFAKHAKYPACDGEVTITAKCEGEPYMGGVDYALAIEATCSVCKSPFVRGLYQWQLAISRTNTIDVTAAFVESLR